MPKFSSIGQTFLSEWDSTNEEKDHQCLINTHTNESWKVYFTKKRNQTKDSLSYLLQAHIAPPLVNIQDTGPMWPKQYQIWCITEELWISTKSLIYSMPTHAPITSSINDKKMFTKARTFFNHLSLPTSKVSPSRASNQLEAQHGNTNLWSIKSKLL